MAAVVVFASLLFAVCKRHERHSDLAIIVALVESTWLALNVTLCDRYFAVCTRCSMRGLCRLEALGCVGK